MIDTKELRRLAQEAMPGPDGVSLSWITLLQNFQKGASPAAISELLDRLEAAEEDRSNFLAEMGKLCTQCDALRAKVAEMERQEPIGYMPLATKAALEAGGTGVVWNCRDRGVADEPLYALPGAQPAAAPTQGEDNGSF